MERLQRSPSLLLNSKLVRPFGMGRSGMVALPGGHLSPGHPDETNQGLRQEVNGSKHQADNLFI